MKWWRLRISKETNKTLVRLMFRGKFKDRSEQPK